MDVSWQPLGRGQLIIQSGFWRRWRDLIGETTLAHEFEEMRADGHMDAILLQQYSVRDQPRRSEVLLRQSTGQLRITARVSWPWWCPCCPPNLARLVSSLSGYLYSQRADSIAIHHYVGSEARADGLTLRMHTGLPFAGDNSVEVQTQAPVEKAVLFRMPGWAGSYKLIINGVNVTPPVENGYVTVRRTFLVQPRSRRNAGLDSSGGSDLTGRIS
jgi:DUF1680 family protein